MQAIVELFFAKLQKEEISPSPRWIFVSLAQNTLWLMEGRNCIKQYRCSTSKRPPSCQYGSMGTPLGLHRIAQKIGQGQPLGTIFEKRESIGRAFTQAETLDDAKGLITSRILWLDGMEPGKNNGYECGSHNRKIYIHGTNLEQKIGQPKSQGCVELTNEDVIELFDQVSQDDLVLID